MPQMGFCCGFPGELTIPAMMDISLVDPLNGGWDREDFWREEGALTFGRHGAYGNNGHQSHYYAWKSHLLAPNDVTEPVRLSSTVDLAHRWNAINTDYYLGGHSQWQNGSLPETHILRPREILSATLRHGATWTAPSGNSPNRVALAPYNYGIQKYRVWVDGVDATGIVTNPTDPYTNPLTHIPLPITFAASYEQVTVAVDLWFINTDTISNEVYISDKLSWVDFEYRLGDMRRYRDVKITDGVTTHFEIMDMVHPVFRRFPTTQQRATFTPSGTEKHNYTTLIPLLPAAPPTLTQYWAYSSGNFPTAGLMGDGPTAFTETTEYLGFETPHTEPTRNGPVQGTPDTVTVEFV